MALFQDECKKWINLIQKLELDVAAAAFKDTKEFKNDEITNKYLFKVLLHLSHAVDKCYREKLSKETEVFTIAEKICKNLKTVSDKNSFYSAVYYITLYLLKNQRFEEAKIITTHLLPGKIVDVDDKYESTKYLKVAVLWQYEVIKGFDKTIANFKKEKNISENIFTYSLFHLKILNCCTETSTHILKAVHTYIQKLSTIPLDVTFPYILKLFKQSLDCFKIQNLNFTEIFKSIIIILAHIFYKRNDAISNSNFLDYFRQCDNFLLNVLKNNTECSDCYEFFRNYTLNLFETNFMTKEVGARFKKCVQNLKNLYQKYGNKNACVQETVGAVALSNEVLFTNLENLVAKQLKGTKVTYEDILKLGDFVKQIHSVLKNRPYSCMCKKSSESQKCSVENDIFISSTAISNFMKIMSKFSIEIVDEKFISTAKILLEELVTAYNELNKSDCKYSSALWDSCGRLIFNIGLISETKFPEKLEKLYEVLCKQIVRRDGLDSKLSSFGLENPVGTSLHRLCNVNYNQEKFREAMTYAAYNALLSTSEKRKIKACDMWATIKLKLLDSEDIQVLTMSKCLKSDSKLMEKLGISVNFDKYDISNVCMKELNSLYQTRGNLILSMKSILSELESMNDDLNYAKGVLLLCFHALQLNKREFIHEFITKALDKLKSYKSKTFDTQILIANLNFFNIIEKLYARGQAVSQQIEEANFTVKAFKALKGKQLFNEMDNETEDEVVPTYGGISIEDDNKLAKELKQIVNMWEACILKNAGTFTSSWEPKFSLETIIICAEYCRLYKFDFVERSSWQIAHKLASELNDYTTCLYVTSRCISLRFINETWINNSLIYVEKLKNSSTNNELDAVVLFWLSLADFYLDCKKVKEAKNLLEEVNTLSNFKMLSNTKLYVYSADIKLRNYSLLYSENSQEDYFQLLVEIHYSMINLHDIVTQDICKFWYLRFQFFACEQIFNVMCNMIIPMNSLISYREVTSHLVYGMRVAQMLGMTIRIAEFLKYLCYIDLLRGKIEECEIKLQDLEHILCLENFQMSMKMKIKDKTNTQSIPMHEFRDASAVIPTNMSKNKASPELKKKMFSAPDFISHSPVCNCFYCSNISYQYLTFSCSHIRAQLYSLLNYTFEAKVHFQGAFNIKTKIDGLDSEKARQCKNYQWKRQQNFTVDGLLCLLDYSVYLIDFYPKQEEDALALIEEIMDVAVKNDLSKHYVYNYATELYLQHFMYTVFQDKISSFSVPDDISITITNQPCDGCVTPKQQIEKVSKALRRKTPPPVAIPIIKVGHTSDEENNASTGNMSKFCEPSNNIVKKTKKPATRTVRRKILTDDCEENGNQPENVVRRSTRSTKKKT